MIDGQSVAVVTATDLKRLYEGELRREQLYNLRLSADAQRGLYGLRCASRRMDAGELREEDHRAVWVWSDHRTLHDDGGPQSRQPVQGGGRHR